MAQSRKVCFKPATNRTPKGDSHAKVCITNHIVEMTVIDNPSGNLNLYRKLDAGHYVNQQTGEIKEYQHQRSPKKNNRNQSFNYLRKLINLNFTGQPCELHIVITYREMMTDKRCLQKDFHRFWDKFRYHYPDCEYIAIPEPHQTGSWHMHVLMKNLKSQRFWIPRKEIEALWGHGYVWVNRLTGNDNIGAYFTVLKGQSKNLEISFEDKQRNDKASRIPFYPTSGKAYTVSRGIQRPEILKMTYTEAIELIDFSTPCFSSATDIILIDGETEQVVNTVYHLQFNAKKINGNASYGTNGHPYKLMKLHVAKGGR